MSNPTAPTSQGIARHREDSHRVLCQILLVLAYPVAFCLWLHTYWDGIETRLDQDVLLLNASPYSAGGRVPSALSRLPQLALERAPTSLPDSEPHLYEP